MFFIFLTAYYLNEKLPFPQRKCGMSSKIQKGNQNPTHQTEQIQPIKKNELTLKKKNQSKKIQSGNLYEP
jgi:hypothetical protein